MGLFLYLPAFLGDVPDAMVNNKQACHGGARSGR